MIWLRRPSAVLDAFWTRDLASPPLSPLASSSKGALCRCGEGMLPCGCTVSLPSPPSLTVLFDFHCYYYLLFINIYIFVFVFCFVLFVFVLCCCFFFCYSSCTKIYKMITLKKKKKKKKKKKNLYRSVIKCACIHAVKSMSIL